MKLQQLINVAKSRCEATTMTPPDKTSERIKIVELQNELDTLLEYRWKYEELCK